MVSAGGVLLFFVALEGLAQAADAPNAPCAMVRHHLEGFEAVPDDPPMAANSEDCMIMTDIQKEGLHPGEWVIFNGF